MTKLKKPEPNPIEKAIGNRAKPKEIMGAVTGTEIPEVNLPPVAKTVPEEIPPNPSEIPDEPTPSEMLTLEELNRRTEERLRDEPEEILPQKTIKDVLTETIPTPVSKLDRLPVTKTSSQESPPQKNENSRVNAKYIQEGDGPVPLVAVVPLIELPPQTPEERQMQKEIFSELGGLLKTNTETDSNVAEKPPTEFESLPSYKKTIPNLPAEDIELTALRKYILEDGFVLATAAFHIVTLCSQPMVTPSTTTWAFRDRAQIPDMVLALLKQPGYIEDVWPSLKIIMSSNVGNSAWASGVLMTIAFSDVIRPLPALKELKRCSETEQK